MTTDRTFTPAQLACIERNRDINTMDVFWAEGVTDGFIEHMEAFGLNISYEASQKRRRIYWDVSYCQGSGAQFEVDSFTIVDIIEAGRRATTENENAEWYRTTDYSIGVKLRELYERLEAEYGTAMLSADHYEVLCETKFYMPSLQGNYNHSGYMYVEFDCEGGDRDHLQDNPGIKTFVDNVEGEAETLQEELRAIADALHAELEDEYEHQQSDEAVWDTIEAYDLFEEETTENSDDELAEAA